MLKIGHDMQRVWQHLCREVFCIMTGIKTPAGYDATESGFTECNFNKNRNLRLYYNIFPRLENFVCHHI